MKLLKLSRTDVLAIVVLVVFVAVISLPAYLPKNGCEVARPDYKCVTFVDVMKENCQFWGKYDCDTNADPSLPDLVWYTQNLCNLQNENHGSGFDCSDLNSVCNEVVGSPVCPSGFAR